MESIVHGPVYQSDGHCHCQRITVFESYGAFQSFYVIGKRDVVVVRGHGCFHHFQGLRLFSAECYLGLVVCHEFVTCAGAADGAYFPFNTLGGKAALPVFRIGYE